MLNYCCTLVYCTVLYLTASCTVVLKTLGTIHCTCVLLHTCMTIMILKQCRTSDPSTCSCNITHQFLVCTM